MAVTLLGRILLVVAVVSFAVYTAALRRLLLTRPRRRGLVRTSVCRVAVAVGYVFVGLTASVGYHLAPQIALGMFIVAQLTWQANSVADVRLARRAGAPGL